MTQDRFTPIAFVSHGTTLRGRLYLPERVPAPAVVMAHGFSATIPMVLDRYAEVFQDAGVAAVAFDHPGLGTSDGEPRGEINPWVSARAYRAAVDWASRHEHIDADRIALWGDSMSSRVALVATAVDERVRALVCQVPAMGRELLGATSFEAIAAAVRDAEVRGELPEWVRLPVVSADQVDTPSALEPHTAFRWFIEFGGRYGTGWSNRIVRTASGALPEFDPAACAPHVRVPTQFLWSPDDEMPGADSQVSRAVFDRLGGPKELVEVAGGHFGIVWHPSPEFDHASAAEAEFLTRVLAAG
jgi:hypothetical protein